MRIAMTLCLAALGAAACAGDVTVEGSGAGGASATAASAQSATTGAGGGEPCGGFVGKQCPSGQYCVFPKCPPNADCPETACGAGDVEGVCKPRPSACTDDYQPVCGCDHRIYGNACSAAAAGVDVAPDSQCEAPSGGTFKCGPFDCPKGLPQPCGSALWCRTDQEYCLIERGLRVPGYHYACLPLPGKCGGYTGVSCACAVKTSPCGGTCQQIEPGELVVSCYDEG